MGRVKIYRRKYPNGSERFIVNEYANGKYYHHRQFATQEAAEKYLETAIPRVPDRPKMLKDYPTAKDNLAKILANKNYRHAKREIV